MSTQPERHPFQADVNQVLSLVVNSLYQHKEVFLRELVSNASDALDQLSFRAVADPGVLGDDRDLRIDVVPDKAARTVSVSDNGVGMTHDELVRNLGTIAHSGTRKLLESLSGDQRRDLRLIGQFGVGFYSAFLVADRVTVVSRAAGSDAAWRWESRADGQFTVEPADRASRGTQVVLHLKDGEDDFLREWTLRELVRKYSDFVRHPIRLRVERVREKGGEETETSHEWEQVNRADALWARPRTEVTKEQYEDLYRHLTHDWEAPLAWTHFKVEGAQELTGLLYVPRAARPDFVAAPGGVRLFVRRVFILDDPRDLVPEWLRFVRGVVDSDDLPLNVSRETLQRDRAVAQIRRVVARHVLQLLDDLAAEGETVEADADGAERKVRRYDEFWRAHGRTVKEGVHSDPANRERIAKLLRFESSAGPGLTSLADYVARMPAAQPAVYHLAAETRAAAEGSPHIEALRARGWEVLYLLDPVDEWVVDALREFDGRRLVGAAKGVIDLPDEPEQKKRREETQGAFAGLVGRLRSLLGTRVSDVRVSARLTGSPACLVLDENAVSPHVERLMRANRLDVPEQKRVLEVNPEHPVIRRLRELAEDPAQEQRVEEYGTLLYDQALVAEGSPPSDPVRFARQVAKLLEEATR